MRLKRELQSIEYQRRSYDDYRQLTSILKEASEKRNSKNRNNNKKYNRDSSFFCNSIKPRRDNNTHQIPA